ncbi:uncharacterized protein LOC120344658 [Styela clava]
MGTRYGGVKLRVPEKFPILLQHFAREVLREQPQDIAKFGAEYFRRLEYERQKTGEDPLKSYLHDRPGFKVTSGKVLRPISSEVRQKEIEQEKAATKIQAGYKGYRIRKNLNRDRQVKQKEDLAATKIQAHYRGYSTRKSLNTGCGERPPIQDISEEKSEKLDNETQQYSDQHEKAAVRIQAKYRGYQTRKSLQQKKKEFEEQPIIDTSDPEMQATADQIEKEDEIEHGVSHDVGKETGDHENDDSQDNKVEMEEAVAEIGEVIGEHDPLQEENQLEDQADDVQEVNAVGDNSSPTGNHEHAAATKIQAQYRGYRTRKQQKNRPAAATKIQANYRGYRARKQLKNKSS